MTKIYSVSISKQLPFDVSALFILLTTENIKICKFTNTALQFSSQDNINMLYWIPRSESAYLKKKKIQEINQ